MQGDDFTTITELRKKVAKFRAARGWDSDPNAKNKAISLVIEATELLEHFQWYESVEVLGSKKRKVEVVDELADVLYWVLAIADNLQIDLSGALANKMKKGEKKYPADKFPVKKPLANLEVYYKLRNEARGKKRDS